MNLWKTPKGVTLIELLIVIAILGLVLSGLYGLLNSANQMFLRTRALAESQQTSRVVMNYLTYRLRQIDGSGLVEDPRTCTNCHFTDQDNNEAVNDADIPCLRDVLKARRTVLLEELRTLSSGELPALAGGIGAPFQNISGGNFIRFWADLLPIHGFPDTFTDSPFNVADSSKRNEKWDLSVDVNGNNRYDPGEDRELLFYDLNDNGIFDYYGEEWTLKLAKSPDGNYYELVESLSFEKKDSSGTVVEDYKSKNNSTYPDTGYTNVPVASGIVALGIKQIPRIPAGYTHPSDNTLQARCGGGPTFASITGYDSTDLNKCHGSQTTVPWLNIYEDENNFSFDRFTTTHPWWNIKGWVVDLVTVDPTGKKFFRSNQFIIPRNIEINQERTSSF